MLSLRSNVSENKVLDKGGNLMESDEEIEGLIITALNTLNDVYNNKKKLLFPLIPNNETKKLDKRISEQEAELLFILELEKKGTRYSVEVPTDKSYRFTENGKLLEEPRIDLKGNRAGIDVCTYIIKDNEPKINHLIEFKAHSCDPKKITKDFIKLLFDQKTKINYFVHVVKKTDKETFPNIKRKYENALRVLKGNFEKEKPSSLKIFLYSILDKKQSIYYIDKNGELKEIE